MTTLLAIADAEIRQLRADLTAALAEAHSSSRLAEALALGRLMATPYFVVG